MKYLLLLVVLFSCQRPNFIDPNLIEYVQKFEQEFNVYVNYDVKFAKLGDRILGQCRISSTKIRFPSPFDTKPEVLISIDYYNEMMEIFNEGSEEYATLNLLMLVYHELAHCSLGYLEHDDSMIEGSNCHYSLMHSTKQYPSCFIKYYDHYIDDLHRKRRSSGFRKY